MINQNADRIGGRHCFAQTHLLFRPPFQKRIRANITTNTPSVRHPERGLRARRSFAEGALHTLHRFINQSKRADAKPSAPARRDLQRSLCDLSNKSYFYPKRVVEDAAPYDLTKALIKLVGATIGRPPPNQLNP